jgi:predicted amidohydrolase YtcJ
VKGDAVTSADLALIGGNILTLNLSKPHVEAIAVKNDKIVKVGTNEEINQLVGKETKVIRLNRETVVPGLIDTHIHVSDFGKLLTWIDLSGVSSIKEMQKRLSRRVKKSSKRKWLLGRGWDETCLAENRLPTRFDLDLVSPDNPVIFYHQTGKICVVNSKALELAGVTRLTPVPPGGAVDRDAETNELTGVLRDNATNLIWTVVVEPTEKEVVQAAALACQKILEAGVTSVHWMVLSSTELSVIRTLHEQNKLPMRVYVIIPMNLLDSIVGFRSGADSNLKIGGVVISADGYLAAKTAALFQPYNDGSSASANLLCSQEEMKTAASKILKMGMQLVIHAMGDKAVDAALEAIEQTSEEAPRSARIRFEQAAVLNEELIKRIREQNVIVSVQPCVVASEFSVWSAVENLGAERARWLYPIKTLLKEGIRVVGGSDCPMEPLSPFIGIQALVTRKFFPEERLTIDDALQMYTINAAYSSGQENLKGSLEEGKLADFVVLSCDLSKVLPSKIGNVKVAMTVVGGKVVFC